MNALAIYNGELVGMGRIVGDGAMIVNHLVDYAKANSITGKFTTIGGVSAKGKEPFYKKMGFDIISNGIKKMIEIE